MKKTAVPRFPPSCEGRIQVLCRAEENPVALRFRERCERLPRLGEEAGEGTFRGGIVRAPRDARRAELFHDAAEKALRGRLALARFPHVVRGELQEQIFLARKAE